MTLSLRRAVMEDADEIAALFSASFRLLTFLPPLHTPEEDRAYVRDELLARQRVTVAEQDGRIVGLMAETEGWINQLYVQPGLLRQGVGSALIADAKSRNQSLTLWCFLENGRARSFYEKHGFIEVERTDGSGNEAKSPDIRYLWVR